MVDIKLENENIELVQFVGAAGAPVPADARSNDLSFQHVAIIVSDMTRAYAVLRQNHVHTSLPIRKLCRSGTRTPRASRRFTFRTPTGIRWKCCSFLPERAIQNGSV